MQYDLMKRFIFQCEQFFVQQLYVFRVFQWRVFYFVSIDCNDVVVLKQSFLYECMEQCCDEQGEDSCGGY